MRPLLCALLVSRAALAGDWQWRGDLGGEINPASHGVGDLGLRKGAFSLQLLSDTLDVRYAPEDADGRFWLAARGEALFAGLLPSPWTAGAPDPSRALWASYAGVEAGWLRYRTLGVYAGFAASARVYFFGKPDSSTATVPDTTSLVTLDLVLGRWSPELHAWARVGTDLQNTSLQPHLYAEVIYHPVATIAPRLELRAGAGYHQTFLTRTRLGGLNPYVVPLAGAGWAEFLVDDFVAARLAVAWSTRFTEAGAAVDAAAFDQRLQTGFALLFRGHYRRWFGEAQLGWAPWIERQPGVANVSLWLLVGADWGAFR